MATLWTLIWVITYSLPGGSRPHDGVVYFRNAVSLEECTQMAQALLDHTGTNAEYPLQSSRPICAPVNGRAD